MHMIIKKIKKQCGSDNHSEDKGLLNLRQNCLSIPGQDPHTEILSAVGFNWDLSFTNSDCEETQEHRKEPILHTICIVVGGLIKP